MEITAKAVFLLDVKHLKTSLDPTPILCYNTIMKGVGNMRTIWYDMDGTIADLYGVENWLDYLQASDPYPYMAAGVMHNMSILARYLNQLQRAGFADMLVQAAAELVRDVVFPVGKRAGPAEAAHDRAGLATYAAFDFVPVNRAFSLFKRLPELQHRNLQRPLCFFRQFPCSEDAPRACADDQNVVIHIFLPL